MQTEDKGFILFCGYCFCSTLGAFARISDGVSTIGISSILLICIIFLKFGKIAGNIRKEPILWLWLILLAYISIVTFLTIGRVSFSIWGYRQIGSLLLYVLFAAAVASLDWNRERVYQVACCIAFGLMIAASACFVDGLRLIDIPRVNDSPTLQGDFLPYGHFRHRSVLGLYMAVFLCFLFVFADSKRAGTLFRYATLLSGLYFISLLIYSWNRSGPAALIIAFSLYYFFNITRQRTSFIRWIPDFFIIFAAAVVIVATCNPQKTYYYYLRWVSTPGISQIANKIDEQVELPSFKGFSKNQGKIIYKADMIRANLFKKSFSQASLYPFGRGFINDPHVACIIDIVYAAGIFGILWLLFYLKSVVGLLRNLFNCQEQWTVKWALVSSLVAWVLVGSMYNSLYMGIGWGFLGITLSYRKARVHKFVPENQHYLFPSRST